MPEEDPGFLDDFGFEFWTHEEIVEMDKAERQRIQEILSSAILFA